MKSLPRAFTLIEVIIAMTIFATLATLGVVMLDDVAKIRQEVQMEEYLYTETQALMERLAQTIQASAIDYEEYFNQELALSYGASSNDYGENYGLYHEQFYSGSFDMGMNPATGSPNVANAQCSGSALCSRDAQYHTTSELYLINKTGDLRTYFAIEEGALSTVELEGIDTDGDDLIDAWVCTSDFTCNGTVITDGGGNPIGTIPDPNDLTDGNHNDNNFTRISPSNVTIDTLSFFLSPIEDPFKGFDETDSSVFKSVQLHPRVTIGITTHYDTTQGIANTPTSTTQTTIGTGVYSEIPAYNGP